MTLDNFITKWQPILTHWNSAAEDPQFADDCWACEFEMDGGKSFVAAFPDKRFLTHADELLEVIKSVESNYSAVPSSRTGGCLPMVGTVQCQTMQKIGLRLLSDVCLS